MKRLLTLFTLLLLGGSLMAQISFGPKVGLNLSKYAYNWSEDWNEPEVKFRMGPSIGGVMNLEIASFLAFQPALNISVKGVAHDVDSWNSGQFVYTGYDRVRVAYAEIPLNLAFGVRLGQGQIQVFAGPYIAFAFCGVNRWDYEENDNGIRTDYKDSKKVKFTNEVSEEQANDDDVAFYQKPFDYGVDFGLGYRYNQLLFNVGFAMGLANLQPDVKGTDFDPKDYKYTNSNVFISAAWLFGGD